jgi:hypothetical protein
MNGEGSWRSAHNNLLAVLCKVLQILLQSVSEVTGEIERVK